MGSLSRTVRPLTCSSSSAFSPRLWPPPSSTTHMGRTATLATATTQSNTQSTPLASSPPAPRTVVKLGSFLEINGMFEEGTTLATGVTSTIKGNFNIQQNGLLDLFSGNEAKITAYIMSSNDLTGQNIKLHIGTGTDCAAALAATGTDAPVEIAMVNVPPSINGFYVNARTTGFNIDGMNGKTSLMGATKWLLVTEAGVGIGGSMASLQ